MFRMTSLLLRKCPRFKELAASHPAHGQKVLLDIENRTEKALAFIRQSKGSRTDSVDASVSALWQLQEAPPQPRWSAISKEDWVRTHARSTDGRTKRTDAATAVFVRGLPRNELAAYNCHAPARRCPCRRRTSPRFASRRSSSELRHDRRTDGGTNARTQRVWLRRSRLCPRASRKLCASVRVTFQWLQVVGASMLIDGGAISRGGRSWGACLVVHVGRLLGMGFALSHARRCRLRCTDVGI